jgi:hypothetical protein
MFYDVVGPHPVEDELGFVGHADDVVLHGVGQQSTLVNLKNKHVSMFSGDYITLIMMVL